MELLTGFNRDSGVTIVMITHEAEIAAYARRVVRFADGMVVSDVRQEGAHGRVG